MSDLDVSVLRYLTAKMQGMDLERGKMKSGSLNKVVDLFTFQTETCCNILFKVDVLCSKLSY